MNTRIDDGGPTARITGITGGIAGLAATYDRVLRLAASYDEAGDRLRGWAAELARVAADPDIVESAVLAPATFAAAESAICAVVAGPAGLLVDATQWEADAVVVRAVVAGFRAADDLVELGFRIARRRRRDGRSAKLCRSAGLPSVS